MEIRLESPEDISAIRELTIRAFSESDFGYHGEADLIDSLRANSSGLLSLVACQDDEILGHALFSLVKLRSANSQRIGMGLAPMSVLPSHQRQGIGTALVKTGLQRVFAEGAAFVVVLGHPDYYPRLGFGPAAEHHVQHGFAGIPQDVFFFLSNPDAALDLAVPHLAFYDSAFGGQHVP